MGKIIITQRQRRRQSLQLRCRIPVPSKTIQRNADFFTESERFPSLAVALCELSPLGVRSIFFFDPLPSVHNSLPILYAFFTKKCVLLRKIISLKSNSGVCFLRVKPILDKMAIFSSSLFFMGSEMTAKLFSFRPIWHKKRARPRWSTPSKIPISLFRRRFPHLRSRTSFFRPQISLHSCRNLP